jgi:hypothetical protein
MAQTVLGLLRSLLSDRNPEKFMIIDCHNHCTVDEPHWFSADDMVRSMDRCGSPALLTLEKHPSPGGITRTSPGKTWHGCFRR